MINVIYIGQYDHLGKFNDKKWLEMLDGLSCICNRIIIYTRQDLKSIEKLFINNCEIRQLENPDPTMNIYSYQIDIIDKNIWDNISNCNFNIDSTDSISHMYFFNDNMCIAYLEVEDYENYVLLQLSPKDLQRVTKHMYSLSDNENICMFHKEDINMLVGSDKWKALSN